MKAIVFDFDGVIVESAQLKTQAFAQLFEGQPQPLIDQFVAYHLAHMGISRYVKFRYFYEQLLGQDYDASLDKALSDRFTHLVLEAVKNAPFVPGAFEFLSAPHPDFLFFIASGTPQQELEEIVAHKKLSPFFKQVFGFPTLKEQAIQTVLSTFDIPKTQVLFVGDAQSDLTAATQMGIPFVLRRTPENTQIHVPHEIETLEALQEKIGVLL